MDTFFGTIFSLFKMEWFEWLIVFLGLSFLAYTALIIKGEKSFFLKWAKKFTFDQFIFALPPWWTPRWVGNEKVEFIRTDTHYDWVATFELVVTNEANEGSNGAAISLLQKKLEEMEITFDPQNLQTTKFDGMFFQNPSIKDAFTDGVRLEGTGTQGKEERIYLDIFCLKKRRTQENAQLQYLLFSHWSTVLYGSIEGPYFEEVIKRIDPVPLIIYEEKNAGSFGLKNL